MFIVCALYALLKLRLLGYCARCRSGTSVIHEWTFFRSKICKKQKIDMWKHDFLGSNMIKERTFFSVNPWKPYIYKHEDNLLYTFSCVTFQINVSSSIFFFYWIQYYLLDDELNTNRRQNEACHCRHGDGNVQTKLHCH